MSGILEIYVYFFLRRRLLIKKNRRGAEGTEARNKEK
jgi:hypothetical protein